MRTNVTFVIDASASMSRHTERVKSLLKELVENIKANKGSQNVGVSFMQFTGSVPEPSPLVPIENVTVPSYNPTGISTNLNEAMIKALRSCQTPPLVGANAGLRLLAAPTPVQNLAHLIVIITDGEENVNRFTNYEVKRAVLDAGENVTIALNVPQSSVNYTERYGIPKGNINVWETTTESGFKDLQTQNLGATTSYMTMRSTTGATKSMNMYAQTTDLSGLTTKDVTSKLSNLNGSFMSRRVGKEERIDEFVSRETGQPYLRGMAFYQLTKPEVIQGNKDILLRQKGKVTVWGGPNARGIIGLQPFKDGKITPGNHAEWDIFVQSLADNRKLVRGTDLLIRK